MSSPDDMPKTSKSGGKKREKSRTSSSESISQPPTPPVHQGERPSTSSGQESGSSRHSSGGGRSSHGGQRPPTNMRDRLLVSNANAIGRELSVSEVDEATTSSSSPHMNGHGHTTDDQQPGMSNGSRRSKKKKKKGDRNRGSLDADLIGWTGPFPKLSTASCHLDSNPDLDSQTSDELRARCRRGLMVFPREAQGSEAAAPAAEPHQQQQQSLATSPSPMSSPIESSMSPISELNRNMTPGPELEPGLLPEPEQPTQHEPPTTLATTTSTNVTTTARNSSNCDATATATAATPSASGSPSVSPRTAIGQETELDNQEKSDDKEQKQQHQQQDKSEEEQQQAVPKTLDKSKEEQQQAVPKKQDKSKEEQQQAVPKKQDKSKEEQQQAVPKKKDKSKEEPHQAVPKKQGKSKEEQQQAVPKKQDKSKEEQQQAVPKTQDKSEEEQQQAVPKKHVAHPMDASSSSVSGSSKHQGSPIEDKAVRNDAEVKAAEEEKSESSPTSSPSPKRRKKSVLVPTRPPSPVRPRCQSIDTQPPQQARLLSRFKSHDSLFDQHHNSHEHKPKELFLTVDKPEQPSETADKPKQSPETADMPESPPQTMDMPEWQPQTMHKPVSPPQTVAEPKASPQSADNPVVTPPQTMDMLMSPPQPKWSPQDAHEPKWPPQAADNPVTPPQTAEKPVSPPLTLAEPKSPPLIEVKSEPLPSNTSTLKLKPTDEFYRLPFSYGWKRELVLPSNTNSKRRAGDVFFISPSGRKLRSREDILPLLEGELTIEHFCFQRQAQEAGPEFELVRRATPSVVRSRVHETVQMCPVSEQLVTGKRVPKPKVPKGASPPSEGWTATTAVKRAALAASSSRRRSALPRQPPKETSSSYTQPGCALCQGPLQGSNCSNCSGNSSIMVDPPAPLGQQPPPVAEEDDADTASACSVMEIGEEVEVRGGHFTPGQSCDEEEPPPMQVVVIDGRKAIAITVPRPRPPVKLVPRLPDLTTFDRIYRKRIQDKKLQQSLAMGLSDSHIGVNVLTAVMKTLNMQNRANMAQACSAWATISRDNRIWNRVILRDTHLNSWKRLLYEMARHRTRELDMMGVKMTDPKIRYSGDMRILKSLRILRTDATTNEFIKLIQCNLPQLTELRTTCVSSQLHLSRLEKMKKLRVLRINMTHPKAHAHFINNIGHLKLLTELSLRGMTNLNNLYVTELKHMPRLEVLSLGSCEKLDLVVLGRDVLPYLKTLHTIRIENDHRAMAMFPVHEIMLGVAHAGGVRRLELINVDVDNAFSSLLANCSTVARLLLTPKCLHNTAEMTNAVMQAMQENANHLIVFRLGLVTQLLSATENLYKGTQKNVIPVQRPVPGIPEGDPLNHCSPEDCREEDHSQCVAFLPVERLESILNEMMPKGSVSVAKVAMSDTTKMQFLAPGETEST